MKNNSPWLKGATGSAAGMTGQQSRGISVLRQKPVTVANPRSTGQVLQRNRMKRFQEIASAMNPVLAGAFQQKGKGNTNISYFTKLNLMIATEDSTPSNILVDYGRIRISKGNLRGIVITEATYNHTTGATVITWQDAAGIGGAPNDSVVLVVYNKTRDLVLNLDDDVMRQDGTVTVTLGADLTPSDLVVYGYAKSLQGIPSDSAYQQVVTA